MPFYIKKSVRVGPFQFNLSKSGIGVSAGLKGFRIGTGPRGHLIHAGRGGLYYRSILGSVRRPTNYRSQEMPLPPRTPPAYGEPQVEMIRVSSGDVLQMQDARFTDILAEINAKQNSISFKTVLGWSGAAFGGILAVSAGALGAFFGVILTAMTVAVGGWIDSFRRVSVLIYDLEEGAQEAYIALTNAFDSLAACAGIWHIGAGGTVRDIHTWKRNAGAGHIIDRRPTTFDYSLPALIKSNITPPAIRSGKETLYFFPDLILVVEKSRIGAVSYDDLVVRAQVSHFIEEDSVPSDTRVISYTWKHPNKTGGPDRRFADNRQIPVCEYESMLLTSSNGLNELLQVSRVGMIEPFAAAARRLAAANGADMTSPSSVSATPRLSAT